MPCTLLTPLPGDDVWLTQEYSGKNWSSLVIDVTACTGGSVSYDCDPANGGGWVVLTRGPQVYTPSPDNADLVQPQPQIGCTDPIPGNTDMTTDSAGQQKHMANGYCKCGNGAKALQREYGWTHHDFTAVPATTCAELCEAATQSQYFAYDYRTLPLQCPDDNTIADLAECELALESLKYRYPAGDAHQSLVASLPYTSNPMWPVGCSMQAHSGGAIFNAGPAASSPNCDPGCVLNDGKLCTCQGYLICKK